MQQLCILYIMCQLVNVVCSYFLQSLCSDNVMQLFHSTDPLTHRHTAIQLLHTHTHTHSRQDSPWILHTHTHSHHAWICTHKHTHAHMTYPQDVLRDERVLLLIQVIFMAPLKRRVGSGVAGPKDGPDLLSNALFSSRLHATLRFFTALGTS